ncbi:MAG: hypothetical protein KAT05_18010 [Spirochaetes bacterium]|nr:hypothetical protein [Spirochaetota bacterium]
MLKYHLLSILIFILFFTICTPDTVVQENEVVPDPVYIETNRIMEEAGIPIKFCKMI